MNMDSRDLDNFITGVNHSFMDGETEQDESPKSYPDCCETCKFKSIMKTGGAGKIHNKDLWCSNPYLQHTDLAYYLEQGLPCDEYENEE